MGLGDILGNGPLRERVSGEKDFEDMTVSDLKEHFGEEAVNRGLSYMASLSDAENNYKESIDRESMEDGYDRAAQTVTDDDDTDADSTKIDEATTKWAEESKDSGLGLDG